jgi:predicted membrane protein
VSRPPQPSGAPAPDGGGGRPDRSDAAPGRVLDLGRLLLGLVVVSLGSLFLLDSAGALDAGRAIDRWWPVVLVAAGALTLAERPPSIMRGTLLTGAGLFLLAFTTDLVDESAWSYVWPALLIVAGLAIVVRWGGRAIPASERDDDVVRSTAIFGGSELASTAQRFRGAWLTAIFGGITLDLRDAVPAAQGASVNATAAFGGIEILVPRGWRISTRSTPILGGLEDKTDHASAPAADAPTLHVDVVAILGGVEIKHDKDD